MVSDGLSIFQKALEVRIGLKAKFKSRAVNYDLRGKVKSGCAYKVLIKT